MNLSCPHCYLVSQPVCKTIKSKSLPHQNVDPYHSEPSPTGILPSISPGHLGHLFPPKQVERENDWVSITISKYLFHDESSCCIWIDLCPITWKANPHIIGLPTNTALAPRARAFRTSVPFLTPPSRKTSTFPSTASTISGRTSICGKKRSSRWHWTVAVLLFKDYWFTQPRLRVQEG